MQIITSIDGPIEVIDDQGSRPDPSYLDQFTTAQLQAEVERRRREDVGRIGSAICPIDGVVMVPTRRGGERQLGVYDG